MPQCSELRPIWRYSGWDDDLSRVQDSIVLTGCGPSATLFSVLSNGSVTGHGGRCMDALPTLRMAPCDASSISQKWSITGGTIRLTMQQQTSSGLGARVAPLDPTNLWQVHSCLLYSTPLTTVCFDTLTWLTPLYELG
eukprot:COSAG02_NODE_2687_length_8234_cov_83.523417_9_plen_138_part_00